MEDFMKSIKRYLMLALIVTFSLVALIGCSLNAGDKKINISMPQTLYIDEEVELNATLESGSLENVIWSLDNDKVAKIENGKLIALSEGTFNLTASYENVKDIKHFVVIDYTYYHISYVLNGGVEDENAPLTLKYRNIDVIVLNVPVKVGYEFKGFYDNADFTGTVITQVNGYEGSDLTLYAKWEVKSYTISYELEEVLNLSDRILVMYEGEIVGELDPKTTTPEELGLYMAGAKRNVGQNTGAAKEEA